MVRDSFFQVLSSSETEGCANRRSPAGAGRNLNPTPRYAAISGRGRAKPSQQSI